MESHLNPASLKDVLIVLGAAGVVIPLFYRLRISPVLGFMLVGVAVGPFGFGRLAGRLAWLSAVTIADPEAIAPIARLGVVLLLFMIGLELTFERLWLMRRLVFGLGGLQILICTLLLGGVVLAFRPDPIAALVIGLAGAMSSTAVVIQVLAGQKRLGTAVGRGSFAILLCQDLAAVPALFALRLLAAGAHRTGLASFGLVIGQAIVAMTVVVVFGRLALRPLFRSVARTQSPELFVAACLLVVLGSALASDAAGLSMALGALIGGLLLAGTEYRRQVEVTIDPFKGLLVGVFLISVGMGLDPAKIVANPAAVLGAALALVGLKAGCVAGLARLFGLSWASGVQSGLLLGPGGEFSFVMLAVALPEGLLPRELADFALIVAALTMASIPLLSSLGDRLAPRITRQAPADPALLVAVPPSTGPRVIIAGFGRVGQVIASMLDVHHVAYVAIDKNPDRVAYLRGLGKPVYYGDITQLALLNRLELGTAQALVVSIDEDRVVDDLVAGARAARPDLLIVARARHAVHAAHLYRIGASDAVPDTVEASLQLAEAVLVDVGIAMGPVIASIHQKRADMQARIKAMAPEAAIRPLGRRRLRDAATPESKARALPSTRQRP
jgi:CPA2 family monovalent cation:H+ antiporter-2